MVIVAVRDGCWCGDATRGFFGLVVWGGTQGIPPRARDWRARLFCWETRHSLSRVNQSQGSSDRRCGRGWCKSGIPGLWGLAGWGEA